MERRMKKSKLANAVKKVLIGLAVSIAVLFALLFVVGIPTMFYTSYKSLRVPIYQIVMTDFELVVQPEGISDNLRSELQQELQSFIDKFEIKTFQCFVFKDHTNRPTYCILMVGRIPADADFSEYAPEKHPLKRNIMLFSTLKLCGAEPQESEDYLELSGCFFDYRVFIYHSHIILEKATRNPTVLRRDEQKRALLEKYISPRKK